MKAEPEPYDVETFNGVFEQQTIRYGQSKGKVLNNTLCFRMLGGRGGFFIH